MSYAEFFSAFGPLVGSREERGNVLTVLGVPFDGTTSYRPGARFGPNAIREAFLNVEAYSNVLKVDVEKLKLRDLGNLSRVSGPDETTRMVTKVTKELVQRGQRY
ncbi:MAG: arginase family protein, partial [Thaumarchaeota archaeon]|nr:arginase family protein [Nitrososphaerota archaeon]